ncbi:uncharacterized protein At4g38062-like [Gastrolobium bilobum]|uniref:uncharacterized protein At4g38062-like n=1 Tax=Gastrolobium bilobum TaxID=150636 RepID=UPI002AB09E1F|nr:uncharacterized protein At4g38062-like [Gastrolobium bilobum]
MDNNDEELDEAKAEIEKLNVEELRGKTDSLQNLNKSHDAQVNQIQEAISKVEKLDQELLQKADGINDAKQMHEHLNGNLNNNESITKHLSAANDKLGAHCDEKFKKWEDEKRRLVLALEEANEKVEKQEQQMHVYRQEIESLKGCLSVAKEKCLEIEKILKAFKELGETDEYLNSQRDYNIGDVRYSLKTKEAYYKESKYSIEKLEQENHELRKSLKRLKEARIQEAGTSYSLSILRSNLRDLEQSQRECVSIFKARQAEWSFQLEKLTGAFNSCRSELEAKAAEVEELKMELECSHSLSAEMMLLNEEMSVMLLVLKLGISEAQMKLSNDQDEMDVINKERKEKCFQLMKQLEMKDDALISAQKDINEERENASCLMSQVESYGLAKELQHSLQNDLKEQLEEAYDALGRANIELDEKICERSEMEFELQIWKSFVERLRNDVEENLAMRKELENSLLAQVDFSESLEQEKDTLVYKLEEKENRIDYLLQQVFLLEQELKARDTQASVPVRGEETAVSSETGEVRYLQIIEDKDKILDELQKEVLWLEQESFRREFESTGIAKSNLERTNELEENPMQFIKGKNMRIDELMQQVTSTEQQFTSSLTPFSSHIAEKKAEINHIQEACDMITAAEVLAALEIEEKKLMIVELDTYIHDIEQKLKLQEENRCQPKHLALDIEAEMDAKQLKIKELTDQMENKLRGSDVLLQNLKMENRNLLENATRLSSERDNLLGFVLGLGDKMCECTTADTQLMDIFTSIMQALENDYLGMNLKKDDELLVKENMIMHSPTGVKKPETFSDIRSPFKELNS